MVLCFLFLWNKKPSKIKQATVIKQYGEGGLKMINIMAFIEALKSTWIRQLLITDNKWQMFIKKYIQIEKLTGCNIKYIEEMITHLPNKFWKDVLLSLIKINKKMAFTEADILKSPLYYNDHIKIDGSYIFFESWFNKGIKYINDLIDENGEFYRQDNFTRKTGVKTNFLQYNGLIKSIKEYLKHIKIEIPHKESNPFIPTNIYPLLKHCNGSKVMYEILNKTNESQTGQVTWNKIYNITKDEWKVIYIFPFRVTKYPALQWFQICINHNILVTNKLLQQMKIKNDALCTFCQTSNESIVHLFWQCNKTQQFIRSVTAWLNTFGIHCDISEKYFIFGWQEEQCFTKVLNFIILYAKYYIYLARCNKLSLSLIVFKTKLKFMFKVHKQIAYSKQEDEKFLKEWSPYQLLINDIS